MKSARIVLGLLLVGSMAVAQERAALAGWDALQRGDAARAASAFREALALSPSDATLHLGAGLAAYMLGRESQAVAELRRALTLDRRLVQAAAILGQIAYSRGDLDEAIELYRRALAVAPHNGAIARQLDAWTKEADLNGRFHERAGISFRVLFEGREERALADRVVQVLESAYWRIGRQLDSYPAETITVVLYTDEQFREITRGPAWSDGTFDGRIRLAVRGALENPAELDRLVVHEFVHAVVRQAAPTGVPVWLHEGLASYFEPGDHAWVHEVLRSATLVPLRRLEDGFDRLSGPEALVAYAQSELAARILVERLGPNLPVFLQGLGRGQTLADELSLHGLSLDGLQSELVRRAKP